MATNQARQATTWAAGTLTARGYTLHATQHGWDVEHPDGSWTACNSWQALADLAKAVR